MKKKKDRHRKKRRGRVHSRHSGSHAPPRAPVKPELLAPAGIPEAFEAAIRAGADAVYAGIGSLNARAFARNFSVNDIMAMARYAHEHGRRLFIALNSVMKEDELPATVEALAAIEESGADAVIIQDLGVWRLARRYFPNLRLHASTLMTIHNSEGVLQARKMGFSRVVLAREMTLREIRETARKTSVELEVFIHGAMCFTYSGLCMFSSFHGGKSSTRGRCVQPCRRIYQWAGRKGRFFSMDDLDGIEQARALGRAGISSLKIEGRLKPPHYVESVVRAYRMVLDMPEDSDEKTRIRVLEEARGILAGSLGRPGSSGYFLSASPHGAVTPTRAAVTGQFIGKVLGARNSIITVGGGIMPANGDRLRLVNNAADRQEAFTCRGINPLENRDGVFEIVLPDGLQAGTGDLVFRTDMAGSRGASGKPQWLRENSPPASLMKETRKRARQVLEDARYGKAGHCRAAGRMEDSPAGKTRRRTVRQAPLWVRIRGLGQLDMARSLRPEGIIITVSETALKRLSGRRGEMFQKMEVVWSLPPVIHEEKIPLYRRLVTTLIKQGYRNFMVANLGHVHMLGTIRARGSSAVKMFGDYTLNIMNSQAVRAARDSGISVPQLSMETDEANAAAVLGACPRPLFLTVFAWVPLFTSRLNHSSYAKGRPIRSSRGETLYWQRGNGANILVADRPFSIMKHRNRLSEMGFSALVADLSNWPAAKKTGRDRGKKNRLEDFLMRGREFNFSSRLW